MTSTSRLLLVLALSLCAGFAYADPPARAGRLNYLNGTVALAPAASPEAWAVAVLNRPLATGDRLWTDRDGYAEFHVGSTAVRLAPRTNVDMLTLDDDTLQLRLAQGDVNVRVRDVAQDTIEIDTPNGAVLLEEAGSYRVSTSPEGDTTNIIVHFGRAHVLAQTGSFAVRSGQHVTLRGVEGAPSDFVAANMDAFDRWSAELDRREDQIASTRYVSPHMTGYEDLDAHGTWRTMPEYGAVWVPRVAAGWAPYRHGHWVWVEPWGWTWVDDAPWGFAPFHYGRWVWLNGHWAWAPGPRVVRPVYAPALVAFVGGSSWSVSVGSGPAVGWFPLGWREPFIPWYRTSPVYVRNVNVTHVKNVNIYNNVTRINYVNQSVPQAVTVVPRDAFVSARPVARSVMRVPEGHAARAPLMRTAPAEPTSSSFVPRRAESQPPETVTRREVIAARQPRARVSQEEGAPVAGTPRGESERASIAPRVRVIERSRSEADTRRDRVDAPARAAAPSEATPRAAPETSRQPEARAQGRAEPRGQKDDERRRRTDDARAAPETARPPEPRPQTSAAPQAQRNEQRRADDEPRAPRPAAAQREERRAPETARPPEARARDAESPQPKSAPPQARPDPERERRAAPAPRPQAEERPRAEREPRAAPERREDGAPRSEPQPRPRTSEPEVRERRAPPNENRPQSREPRSQVQPAPQASARPDTPRPQRAPEARPSSPPPPRAQAQAPDARPSPPPRAQAPQPEARGPQGAPPPRANGGGRENRDQRENRKPRD